MAHRFLKLSLVCMAIIASTDLKAQQAPVLWYDSPAEYWEEALPLGNGTKKRFLPVLLTRTTIRKLKTICLK